MVKKEKGITLIALVITIVVLLIIAGISIGGTINSEDAITKKADKSNENAQKQSFIQKLEADLYSEKVKTGEIPSKEKLKEIIINIDSTADTDSEEDYFTINNGKIKIPYAEILGWK